MLRHEAVERRTNEVLVAHKYKFHKHARTPTTFNIELSSSPREKERANGIQCVPYTGHFCFILLTQRRVLNDKAAGQRERVTRIASGRWVSENAHSQHVISAQMRHRFCWFYATPCVGMRLAFWSVDMLGSCSTPFDSSWAQRSVDGAKVQQVRSAQDNKKLCTCSPDGCRRIGGRRRLQPTTISSANLSIFGGGWCAPLHVCSLCDFCTQCTGSDKTFNMKHMNADQKCDSHSTNLN